MSSPTLPARPLVAADAFRLLFVYLAGQLAGGIAAAIGVAIYYAATVGLSAPGAVADAMRMATVLGAVIGIIVAGRMVRWRLLRERDAADCAGILAEIGWVGSSYRAYALAAVAGLALGALYLAAMTAFPPRDSTPGMLGRAAESGGWALLLWSFLAVAVAPPVEEFFYRGVLWTGLRRSLSPLAAGALVTAIFTAMHLFEAWGSAVALIAIATLAVLTLLVRIRMRSFVPGIFMHAAYNAVLVAAVMSG